MRNEIEESISRRDSSFYVIGSSPVRRSTCVKPQVFTSSMRSKDKLEKISNVYVCDISDVKVKTGLQEIKGGEEMRKVKSQENIFQEQTLEDKEGKCISEDDGIRKSKNTVPIPENGTDCHEEKQKTMLP